MSNTITIRTEADFEEALRKVLQSLGWTGVRIWSQKKAPFDFVVEGKRESYLLKYQVDCKMNASAKDVDRLAQLSGKTAPMLATVQLSDSILARCRERNVSCLDLNGRAWLKQKGLLIDRDYAAPRMRYATEETAPDFFSLKSSRLARVLLSYPDRQWKQAELAQATGLSQGLISRLLNHAESQGWVSGTRGNWTLQHRDALLDEWTKADDWSRRGSLREYATLERSFTKLATEIASSVKGEIALTQWFAAEQRYPYTTPPVVSVYLQTHLSEKALSSLGLQPVTSGGRLWVITPRDQGVFQAKQEINGLPLVSDVQIYLDLLKVGLRGPDQAKALRSWAGFCR